MDVLTSLLNVEMAADLAGIMAELVKDRAVAAIATLQCRWKPR